MSWAVKRREYHIQSTGKLFRELELSLVLEGGSVGRLLLFHLSLDMRRSTVCLIRTNRKQKKNCSHVGLARGQLEMYSLSQLACPYLGELQSGALTLTLLHLGRWDKTSTPSACSASKNKEEAVITEGCER